MRTPLVFSKISRNCLKDSLFKHMVIILGRVRHKVLQLFYHNCIGIQNTRVCMDEDWTSNEDTLTRDIHRFKDVKNFDLPIALYRECLKSQWRPEM